MLSPKVYICGSGVYTPPHSISNEELVESYNAYVALNQDSDPDLARSNEAFIERASGIKSRFVMDKAGILDPERMRPRGLERAPGSRSLPCEMAVNAAEVAIQKSGLRPQDIDLIIAASSNLPRAYPALAIEIQAALGIEGYAFDLNVACSSAVFALKVAYESLLMGSAKAALIINPEICSAHLNFKVRDSHFIFGDAASALVLQKAPEAPHQDSFEIQSTALKTHYSTNIRNHFGFLNHTTEGLLGENDLFFHQNGPKVYKEVVHMVAQHLLKHSEKVGLKPSDYQRLWLHQANLGMNQAIAKRFFGRQPMAGELPIILDKYANTSSAGSIIAFHLYNEDLEPGAMSLLSAFGAGYSVGSVILRKVS